MVLAAISLGLVVWELVRYRRKGWAVAVTGLVATVLLLAAVLRPVRVSSRVSPVGPRVVVLLDQSASMALPGDDGPRTRARASALLGLREAARDARLALFGFGNGAAVPLSVEDELSTDQMHSDLMSAIASLTSATEERASALVVVSDGRLDRPGADLDEGRARAALQQLGTPVHTVSVGTQTPPDASIKAVAMAGAAVAHQSVRMTVTVGCFGGLDCGNVPIAVRELVESGAPLLLAAGVAPISEGEGTVALDVTLDRAGSRVVEVAIRAPQGDTIPDNDRRFLTFEVTRDRVRILHIAGRPTYDVRALRQWLKSDASLDVVTFFILREMVDDLTPDPHELSLIQFPVDELFSEHLPSFDAVVLQDFDAVPYGLSPHLRAIAAYVRNGGGLVMVGGHHAFSAGGYAGTPLEPVLPVRLVPPALGSVIDTNPFVPTYTLAGRETPVLDGLRALIAERLPQMSGASLLGDAHDGTVVLWEHPSRKTANGSPMPVLALGDHGNGRSLAVAVDGTHKLAFSEMAAETAGRAYGALWDALVGWLMRDPRYEPARIDLERPCVAGVPVAVRIRAVPGLDGDVSLRLGQLGSTQAPWLIAVPQGKGQRSLAAELPPLEPGGYFARLQIGSGPSTRRDFSCERGGEEWADPRPDAERLETIARATGGRAVSWRDAGSLTFPHATTIASERRVSAVAPPWVWTLAAAVALGLHWIARRTSGLV
jgi:uncharacterized membrane protein